MESGYRGIVLENELTCSVSWPPSFMPWPEAQTIRQRWGRLAQRDSFCYEFWVYYTSKQDADLFNLSRFARKSSISRSHSSTASIPSAARV